MVLSSLLKIAGQDDRAELTQGQADPRLLKLEHFEDEHGIHRLSCGCDFRPFFATNPWLVKNMNVLCFVHNTTDISDAWIFPCFGNLRVIRAFSDD